MINPGKIKQWAGSHWHNIPGWHTNRKIVVFESDDWGSIRMPSREVYDRLLKTGIRVDKSPFMKYDSLESESDLVQLFEILRRFKDFKNRSPVITANTIMGNPDFDKIQITGFNEYYYEPFIDTHYKYFKNDRVISLYKAGIKENIFIPQLHGREHLNINYWTEALRKKNKHTTIVFQEKVYALDETIAQNINKSFLPAFDYEGREPLNFRDIIEEAQNLFKSIFEYSSKSFIAPNYTWSINIEKYLKENEVQYIQSSRGQLLPLGTSKKRKYIKHYLGEKNKLNQIYLVRNCYFEPTAENYNKNVIDKCLKQIETAFYWKKPAIISTHRLNYIGSIDEKNRYISLSYLNELLINILNKWPEVEFCTSYELGDLITNGKY